MPTIDLVDLQKKKVGTVDLSPQVFGCEPRVALVHEAVIMQRACERRGKASTLRRGEVSGSGKKAMEAKAHGACKGWVSSLSCLAPWGKCVWAEASQLRLFHAEEEVSYRTAECLIVQSSGEQIVCRVRSFPATAKDKVVSASVKAIHWG